MIERASFQSAGIALPESRLWGTFQRADKLQDSFPGLSAAAGFGGVLAPPRAASESELYAAVAGPRGESVVSAVLVQVCSRDGLNCEHTIPAMTRDSILSTLKTDGVAELVGLSPTAEDGPHDAHRHAVRLAIAAAIAIGLRHMVTLASHTHSSFFESFGFVKDHTNSDFTLPNDSGIWSIMFLDLDGMIFAKRVEREMVTRITLELLSLSEF